MIKKKSNFKTIALMSVLSAGLMVSGCDLDDWFSHDDGGGPSSALKSPSGIAFNGNNVYFTNSGNNSYTQCTVDTTGLIESNTCIRNKQIQGLLSNPVGIAFNESYVYFINSVSNSYTQCTVGTTGIESNTCATVMPSGLTNLLLNNPIGITFNGNYAYITNSNNNSYTQCTVGTTTGIESNTCATVMPFESATTLLNSPSGIAFNQSYAYIINSNNNSYTQCTVGTTGIESSTCVSVTPSGSGSLNNPFGIAFNESYVYITNSSSSNSYTQCAVDTTGLIESSTCVSVTPSGLGSLNYPKGIAFNGSYVYIVNGGYKSNSYTQCTVGATGIESNTCITITPML